MKALSLSSSSSQSNGSNTAGMGKAADRLRSVRSRFRSNRHQAAHDDEDPRSPTRKHLRDHPLVPSAKPTLIESDTDLADLIERLHKPCGEGREPCFAYDSEFIGESTYHPKLCLIQVATPELIALIDPLADLDLTPFWNLLADKTVRKIVHAGEQDLEPAVRVANVEPANVLDTQIAAGFCALPYPTSLTKLVDHVTSLLNDGIGVRLGKGLTFTQWDQRPLSKKQLAYGADDVRYLPLVADWIDQRLRDDERLPWSTQECANRASREELSREQGPWERVRGTGSLDGRQQAIMRELAVWRDAAARSEDLPPRVLVRDEVIVSLSRRPPATQEVLASAKYLPRPVAERYGDDMLAAIERGKQADPLPTREGRPEEPTLEDKFVADAAWALLQTIAHARGIDPNLLASRRETEMLVRLYTAGRSVDKHPLLMGWRRQAAGDRLVDLLAGGAMTFRWNPREE